MQETAVKWFLLRITTYQKGLANVFHVEHSGGMENKAASKNTGRGSWLHFVESVSMWSDKSGRIEVEESLDPDNCYRYTAYLVAPVLFARVRVASIVAYRGLGHDWLLHRSFHKGNRSVLWRKFIKNDQARDHVLIHAENICRELGVDIK